MKGFRFLGCSIFRYFDSSVCRVFDISKFSSPLGEVGRGSLLVILLLASCSESEVPLYDGAEGIYFNNRTATQVLQDSTEFSFIYYDFDYTDISVKVQTYGRTKDYDRPFSMTVSSADATEGIDYEILSQTIIPAGKSSQDIVVRLHKTAQLNTSVLSIDFTIKANEHFTTDFPGTLNYRILFSNQYNVPPAGWQTMFGGTFKAEKLDLLVAQFPEIPRQDYNTVGAITLAKWSYMQLTITNYISQQIQYYAMGAPYDTQIFDKDGKVLDFTK